MSVRPESQKIAKMPPKYYVIGIMGKSGSGKSTFLDYLRDNPLTEDKINFVRTDTTRARRPKELNVTYNFVTGEDFAEKFLNNGYLEACAFNNNFYGTPYDALQVDKINIGIWTYSGLCNIKANLSANSVVYPIYLQVSDRIRWQRLLERESEENEEDIIEKLYSRHKEEILEFDFDRDFLPFCWKNETMTDLRQNADYLEHLIAIFDNEMHEDEMMFDNESALGQKLIIN